MFSTNLKRSVATLGVVAGLLVAGVPASAGPQRAADGQDGNDTLITLRETSGEQLYVKGPTKATARGISGHEMTAAVKTPASPTSEVFTSVSNVFGLTEHEGAAFRGEVTGLEPSAHGTQAGSEGVKAPANADAWTHGNDSNPGNWPD